MLRLALALLLLVGVVPAASAQGFPLEPATVTHVTDGDTIQVSAGGRIEAVRLIGINTPELGSAPECYGAQAADFAATLLPVGTPVWLERDVSDRDGFGRLLRYVWLTDGTQVNYVLALEGYAQSSSFPPDVRWQTEIRAAEQAARESGRGLWSACALGAGAPAESLVFVEVAGGPPGSRASVTVQTTPGAICDLDYTTPAGTRSQASGLGAKAADGAGLARWQWNIGPSTRPGTGSVVVTCGALSASAPIEIG
ncbi:MAG: thermonuclease family protein [Dehalococcoidia bacterium]